MMCENFFYDGSSMFIAVFKETEGGGFRKRDGDHLVGFAYGFVGLKDKLGGFRNFDNIQFYSQYTGVRPGYERFGLGVPIKKFQKKKVLELMGIRTITCTYDPLTGVNAYRNVHTLGMDVVRYTADIYGEFGGRLNRADVPTDRFTMDWALTKDFERPDYDLDLLLKERRLVTRIEYETVAGKSGPVELEILRGVDLSLDDDLILVEIPFDFYRMLEETDVEEKSVRAIPLDWRMKSRDVFMNLLDRGYEVVDFRPVEIEGRRRDFYVFRK
jgi:predicted GNAT superfamily acetyltransferase